MTTLEFSIPDWFLILWLVLSVVQIVIRAWSLLQTRLLKKTDARWVAKELQKVFGETPNIVQEALDAVFEKRRKG